MRKEDAKRIKKMFRPAGIPLEEVGERLKELHDAIEKHDMAIGADTAYNLQFQLGSENIVQSATMTVYFFGKNE